MKRVDLIKEIAAEFELIGNRLSETEVATVASVVELEPQHLAEIAKRAQKLTGPKNVKLKTVIDKSLLAGIIIRYGNSGSKLSLITLSNERIQLNPRNAARLRRVASLTAAPSFSAVSLIRHPSSDPMNLLTTLSINDAFTTPALSFHSLTTISVFKTSATSAALLGWDILGNNVLNFNFNFTGEEKEDYIMFSVLPSGMAIATPSISSYCCGVLLPRRSRDDGEGRLVVGEEGSGLVFLEGDMDVRIGYCCGAVDSYLRSSH
ncbi:hypothetical protein SASPL_138618 [Salvia splendens]|uniref:Uncharacterized protein n=1 Tax=Salvia splendens TaxID=180675 RepID=A0A8X8WV33_SALSN|nr:hypothetical protein SASPL_138618 [Salvia splendens]